MQKFKKIVIILHFNINSFDMKCLVLIISMKRIQRRFDRIAFSSVDEN